MGVGCLGSRRQHEKTPHSSAPCFLFYFFLSPCPLRQPLCGHQWPLHPQIKGYFGLPLLFFYFFFNSLYPARKNLPSLVLPHFWPNYINQSTKRLVLHNSVFSANFLNERSGCNFHLRPDTSPTRTCRRIPVHELGSREERTRTPAHCLSSPLRLATHFHHSRSWIP